jgi:hypothetical protein
MQRIWIGIAVLALFAAMPALAGSGAETPKPAAAAPVKKSDREAEAAKKSAEKAKTEKDSRPGFSLENEILELKALIQAQAEELAAQREALRQQQARTEALAKQLASAHPAEAAPSGTATTPGTLAATTATAGAAVGASKTASANPPQGGASEDGPPALKFKGITLTPGGFFAAETTWRQRGLVADDNTPFNTVPLSGSSQAHLSEFNAGGRQTRITMLMEGKTEHAKFTGYYEADFLGAGTTSNNNQSNSYVFRQRQAWAQVALNSGWTLTGGQMWSLVTETKKGMDNRTEGVPMVIDHQYNVGFSWARQYGFRVTKNFNNKAWLGMSVEGAQVTLTAHGNANNFLIAAPGVGGGLYNNQANYSFNPTPDFVVKAAFEPGFGHYEVFALVGVARARVFPCATASVASPCSVNGSTSPSALGAFNDERTSGGFGVNARISIQKKVDLGVHFFGGQGMGRYGTGGLPVATVRPNGTLSLLHNYQALGTLELHPQGKLDIYFNFGAEYSARAAYLNASGAAVGYGSSLFSNAGCNTEILPSNANSPGSLGSCTGDTRALYEGSVGFWYRFYKGSRGTVQFGTQYSYVERTTWTGASGTSSVGVAPKGTENMFFTSFRYVLP